MSNLNQQLLMTCTIVVFSVSFLAAQVPSPAPEVAAQVVFEDRYPPRQVKFPNGVKGLPGLMYWQPIGYRPLTLDVYLPPAVTSSPATGFPLISSASRLASSSGCAHLCGTFLSFSPALAPP